MSAWLILPFSLCIGSWLGVIIRRYGSGRTAVWGRSECDSCHAALAARDLVPLASYLLLRGKCRFCGAAISWFHPAVELAALTVGVAALAADGPGARAWIDAGLGWALLLAGWIDAERYILPDAITLPLILAGLGVTWWLEPAQLTDHAAAAAAGYLGFRLVNLAYRLWRGRDGLGQGDAKLLAAAGAWLGLGLLPYEIFVAALIGLAIAVVSGKRDGGAKLPFGPALALACFGLRLMM